MKIVEYNENEFEEGKTGKKNTDFFEKYCK